MTSEVSLTASAASDTAARPGVNAAGPSGSAVVAPGGRRTSAARWRKRGEIAFFVTPALVLFAVFVVWPIITAVQMSLFRWRGFGPMVALRR